MIVATSVESFTSEEIDQDGGYVKVKPAQKNLKDEKKPAEEQKKGNNDAKPKDALGKVETKYYEDESNTER